MNFSITSNYFFKAIINYASSSSFKKASIAPLHTCTSYIFVRFGDTLCYLKISVSAFRM